MADMIHQLDEYVQEGSELWLFNMVPIKDRAELLMDKGNKDKLNLRKLAVKNAVGNPIIRRDLLRLDDEDEEGHKTGHSVTLDTFDSVLILSDVSEQSRRSDSTGFTETSDSRSLASLLIIQDIQNSIYRKKRETNDGEKEVGDVLPPCHPVSEILDTNTRSLLKVADCKGYVMSNQIISSVIAQIAEERSLNVVFHEIMSAEGCETYIRDISCYLDMKTENHVSFWDVALRARQVREVVIGYKTSDVEYSKAGDTMLNPKNKREPRRWCHGDVVIVLSLEAEPLFDKESWHESKGPVKSMNSYSVSNASEKRHQFKRTRSMMRRMRPDSARRLWGKKDESFLSDSSFNENEKTDPENEDHKSI